jgi:hypothetical protein
MAICLTLVKLAGDTRCGRYRLSEYDGQNESFLPSIQQLLADAQIYAERMKQQQRQYRAGRKRRTDASRYRVNR